MVSIVITAQLSLFVLLCLGSLVYIVGRPLNGSGDHSSDVAAAMQRYIARRQRLEQQQYDDYYGYATPQPQQQATSQGQHKRYNTTLATKPFQHKINLF